MRIIAGSLRGRTVKFKDKVGVRPISGRIKQSVFDIIAGLVPGAKVLDLFAGTGAVGLEALSRGAELAVFVDYAKDCVAHIEFALGKMGFKDKGRVLQGNLLADLSWLPHRATIAEYDLVYMGPPYKDDEGKPLAYSSRALARVAEAKLLAPKGWLMLQHHVKEEVAVPENMVQVRQEKYGDTFVDFIRWK